MKQVEVVCAGCGRMFEHREATDTAPNRIHGCCPECNSAIFKNKPKAVVEPAPEPQPAPAAARDEPEK